MGDIISDLLLLLILTGGVIFYRENSHSIAAGMGSFLPLPGLGRKKPWRALPFKWKMLLKEWLEVLLPSNAHKMCSGRLHVQCQRVFPLPKMEVISEFRSKSDLISVLLASCHIPFFMDSKLSTTLRGKQFYVDGAMWRDRDSIGVEGLEAHISLDPRDDPELEKDSTVHYAGMESLTKLVEKGKKYVHGYKRAHYYLDPTYRHEAPISPSCYHEHIAEGGMYFSGHERSLSAALELSRSLKLAPSDYVWA